MIESEVTLLPQPDSPTRPMISPRSTWKSIPSTALTTPSRVWNEVRRPADLEERAGRRLGPAPSRGRCRDELLDDRLLEARVERRDGRGAGDGRPVAHRFSRGSRASRMPSPSRLNPNTVSDEGDAREEDQVRRGEQLAAARGRSSSPTPRAAAGRRGRGTRGRPRRGRRRAMPSVPATISGVIAFGQDPPEERARGRSRRAPARRSRSRSPRIDSTDARMIRA